MPNSPSTYLSAAATKLATHARTLRALGLTTELYRSVREAVRLLGASPHTRKVLVVLSDGRAEDRAYHHQDVSDAARAAGVVIHGLGYPRSVAQTVALQTLRRLADETGGLFVQADAVDYTLPPDVFARLFAAADSGGRLRFALETFAAGGAAGPVELTLAFETTSRSFDVLAPSCCPDLRSRRHRTGGPWRL